MVERWLRVEALLEDHVLDKEKNECRCGARFLRADLPPCAEWAEHTTIEISKVLRRYATPLPPFGGDH